MSVKNSQHLVIYWNIEYDLCVLWSAIYLRTKNITSREYYGFLSQCLLTVYLLVFTCYLPYTISTTARISYELFKWTNLIVNTKCFYIAKSIIIVFFPIIIYYVLIVKKYFSPDF